MTKMATTTYQIAITIFFTEKSPHRNKVDIIEIFVILPEKPLQSCRKNIFAKT